jgi:hypothetical protein
MIVATAVMLKYALSTCAGTRCATLSATAERVITTMAIALLFLLLLPLRPLPLLLSQLLHLPFNVLRNFQMLMDRCMKAVFNG